MGNLLYPMNKTRCCLITNKQGWVRNLLFPMNNKGGVVLQPMNKGGVWNLLYPMNIKGQFNQRAYKQLLHQQIPKVPKDSQVISIKIVDQLVELQYFGRFALYVVLSSLMKLTPEDYDGVSSYPFFSVEVLVLEITVQPISFFLKSIHHSFL